MPKRSKRLERGIESLKKQIDAHKIKETEALRSGNTELAGYYQKEIDKFRKVKEKKEGQLERD